MTKLSIEDSIDFNKVEDERKAFISVCEKVFPREEVENIVKKSLLFKLGKISSFEYYTFIEGCLDQISTLPKSTSVSGFSDLNLKKYIQLVKF